MSADLDRLARHSRRVRPRPDRRGPCVDELLALGVPDMRLATLPASLSRCSSVSSSSRRSIAAVPTERASGRGALRRAGGFGIPETIQHDDLHDGQVFVRDGRNLVLDWGDACVSHPFFTLSVTLEGVTRVGSRRRRELGRHRALPRRLPRAVHSARTTATSSPPARPRSASAGSAAPSTATSADRKPPRRTSAYACSSTADHDASVGARERNLTCASVRECHPSDEVVNVPVEFPRGRAVASLV